MAAHILPFDRELRCAVRVNSGFNRSKLPRVGMDLEVVFPSPGDLHPKVCVCFQTVPVHVQSRYKRYLWVEISGVEMIRIEGESVR